MNPQPKRVAYRNEKIMKAAEGEACTNCGKAWENGETTVFAHFNDSWAGKGGSQKADDCAGVFLCALCHAMLDSGSRFIDDADLRRAYYRTIRRLIDKGVLS